MWGHARLTRERCCLKVFRAQAVQLDVAILAYTDPGNHYRTQRPSFSPAFSKSSACYSHGLCLSHLSPPDQELWPWRCKCSQLPSLSQMPVPSAVGGGPGSRWATIDGICKELNRVQTQHRRSIKTNSSSCSPFPTVCFFYPSFFFCISKICETIGLAS